MQELEAPCGLNTVPFPCPQVQLLVSTQDIQNFNLIRKSLEKLKLLVEEAELWVQTKPADVEDPAPRKGPKVSAS